MKKLIKLILLFIASVFIFTNVADAQTQTAPAKDEQPIVVKAVAPYYPLAARAVKASGNVDVEIKINSEGEVISASAVSGHPLLRATGVVAAKRWKFESVADKKSERKARLLFTYKIVAKKEAGVYFIPPHQVEVSAEAVEIEP